MNLSEVSALLVGIEGVRVELRDSPATAPSRWLVGEHVIAWHRPLSKKDADALTANAVSAGQNVSAGILAGEVIAIHTLDVGEKQAWILEAPETCFDSKHFAGYPAVLIDLQNADPQVVFELADAAAERARG